ncbi:unnamed protein product, partial [marine sediment metagenome]
MQLYIIIKTDYDFRSKSITKFITSFSDQIPINLYLTINNLETNKLLVFNEI